MGVTMTFRGHPIVMSKLGVRDVESVFAGSVRPLCSMNDSLQAQCVESARGIGTLFLV